MKRLSILRLVLLMLALTWVTPLPTQAQPALTWERAQRSAYADGAWTFGLPGHRFVHAGSMYIAQGSNPLARQELMLSVTTALGDTVRYRRLNRLPAFGHDEVTGVVLEADYSLTYFSKRYSSQGTFPTQFVLTNLDTLGQVRWTRGIPGYAAWTGKLLRVTDGYWLLTNINEPRGTSTVAKAHIIKVDEQGSIVWRRTYDSRGYLGTGHLFDIVPCPDGAYLALGYCDDSPIYTGGSAYLRQNHWLVKLAPTGDTIATSHFGTPNVYERGIQVRLTPDGGAAITGVRGGPLQVEAPQLVKVNARLRPQWTHNEPNPTSFDLSYAFLQPLQSGALLTGGSAPLPATDFYQAQLQRFAPTGPLEWEVRQPYAPRQTTSFATLLSQPDGAAYLRGAAYDVATNGNPLNRLAYFVKYANVGVPYVPALCATPLRPNAAATLPAAAPDSLTLFDISDPGPAYAQLVRWRWDLGDGTVLVRPAPGWVRHRYATPPAPGTPVSLTITNNLGCTATQTLYPWGRPSAAQQARALAARTTLTPNPTAGQVLLALHGLRPQGAVRVEVVNTLGQVLSATLAPVSGGALAQPLDLSPLPTGMYLVRVLAGEGVVVKRLTKE